MAYLVHINIITLIITWSKIQSMIDCYKALIPLLPQLPLPIFCTATSIANDFTKSKGECEIYNLRPEIVTEWKRVLKCTQWTRDTKRIPNPSIFALMLISESRQNSAYQIRSLPAPWQEWWAKRKPVEASMPTINCIFTWQRKCVAFSGLYHIWLARILVFDTLRNQYCERQICHLGSSIEEHWMGASAISVSNKKEDLFLGCSRYMAYGSIIIFFDSYILHILGGFNLCLRFDCKTKWLLQTATQHSWYL